MASVVGQRALTPHANVSAERNAAFVRAARTVGPPLLFGLRLWASVCLALYVAFWLELDNAYWAGTSAAIMCQPQLGASLRKGWFRMLGTLVGAVVIVLLSAAFAQDRAPFLVGLAAWVGVCAFGATMLRNFAAYAAALSGYTAAIIASDTLGATGGPDGQAFMLAVTRVSEICLGIVCAGLVLAGTDLGGAPRRLASAFGALSTEIMRGFTGTLTRAEPGAAATQAIRRDCLRRVIALEGTIDQAIGESSRLRSHPPVLQAAVDGLFAALDAWRATALGLAWAPAEVARQEADAVLQAMPTEARPLATQDALSPWATDPSGCRQIYDEAARRLLALPAATPSMRLLADQAARTLTGLSAVLNGLALLVADPAAPVFRHRRVSLRLPDWLPALVNAGRAFAVVVAVELFWIATAWPNGALAITFAAVAASLLAPQADQAYDATRLFMYGTLLAAALAAIVNFTLLPRVETFAGLSAMIGLVLVPAGALIAQPWHTFMFVALTANFTPLLAPANAMRYDPLQFYNSALGIIAGIAAAMLSFRLIPPLSPAFRTWRLLTLTLRDLRRLAAGRSISDWEGRINTRLAQMPEQATPLQRAQLLTALSVGREIVALRHRAARLGFAAEIDAAIGPLAQGRNAAAIAALHRLDGRLAESRDGNPPQPATLWARSRILVMSELLTQHAAYFDAGAPA
jgi:uncharacterized membrane protein YccC